MKQNDIWQSAKNSIFRLWSDQVQSMKPIPLVCIHKESVAASLVYSIWRDMPAKIRIFRISSHQLSCMKPITLLCINKGSVAATLVYSIWRNTAYFAPPKDHFEHVKKLAYFAYQVINYSVWNRFHWSVFVLCIFFACCSLQYGRVVLDLTCVHNGSVAATLVYSI